MPDAFDVNIRSGCAGPAVIPLKLPKGSFLFVSMRVAKSFHDDFGLGRKTQPGHISFHDLHRPSQNPPGIFVLGDVLWKSHGPHDQEQRIHPVHHGHRRRLVFGPMALDIEKSILARRDVEADFVLALHHLAVDPEVDAAVLWIPGNPHVRRADVAPAIQGPELGNGKFQNRDVVST